jgi:hypothetical protein
MLLLPEGQMGEAWEFKKKQCFSAMGGEALGRKNL